MSQMEVASTVEKLSLAASYAEATMRGTTAVPSLGSPATQRESMAGDEERPAEAQSQDAREGQWELPSYFHPAARSPPHPHHRNTRHCRHYCYNILQPALQVGGQPQQRHAVNHQQPPTCAVHFESQHLVSLEQPRWRHPYHAQAPPCREPVTP